MTDDARRRRLLDLIDALRREMASERDGLARRTESVASDAAYLSDSMEEGASARMAGRLDALTDALLHAERRMATLARQIVFMDRLRGQAAALTEQGGDLPAKESEGQA
ncbi:MAG: hypothetical protein INR68_07355 [Methylobacterium mesophilicum]|nr:hypothetical protein [Methylobacterium mesophilicum]